MERLHILDGYGYIFRAHYGLAYAGRDRRGVHLSSRAGMPTGALYVYASMLIRLHLDEHPERIAVAFDAPGRTFRDDLDDQYKATRSETPDDLKQQMPHFRPLTEAFAWPVIAIPGVEADDTIATLTKQARGRGWDVVIYSGDKDLMQLVDDHVVVVDSMRGKTYDTAGVIQKFGVPPGLVGDWLALVGDSSDNVPGVAGVGAKTATRLLTEYGSIGGILANVSSLKGKQRERFRDAEQLERLERSRALVTLKTDVNIDRSLDDLRAGTWDPEFMTKMFTELEFEVLLERLGARGGAAPQPAVSASPDIEPTVASTADAIAAECSAARDAGRFAVRVETDGQRPDRANVVGLAIAVSGRAPAYVPVSHRYLGAPAAHTADALAPIGELLADPCVSVVGHDIKAVARAVAGFGWTIAGVACDTMLVSYLLDASVDATSLEKLAKSVLDAELEPMKKLVGTGKQKISFEAVSIDRAAAHMGRSTAAILDCAGVLEDRLAATPGLGGLWLEVELPLALLLARIEAVGIRIDVPWLRELSDRVGARIAALEHEVYELAGEPVNLGSPKQLSALLFDTLGLRSERMKKTKTGHSTDHEVLEAMVDTHPIIRPILNHRELVKLRGTYIDALPPLVSPRTGRLHTEFRQAVAATGRLSSQDPNLQNIPIRSELGREIRRAFTACEGTVLVSADYSQIEMRVLAHMCQDPVLLKAFREGIDVHTRTAAEVFELAPADVGPNERRVAKAVNYGLVYGQTDFGLARALDISRAEARGYIDGYFERFSRVQDFMSHIVADARERGYARTILGRRRPIPDLKSRNWRLRSAAERVAQNTPIQGSGADIMKLAMLRVDGMMGERGFAAQMLLTVHDELVFEVAEAEAEVFSGVVKAEMEQVYQLSVPLEVDIGIASNWADAH